MKEFAIKHPILTFLIVDSLIGCITKIGTAAFGKKEKSEEPEGDEGNEPASDIQ